MSTSVALPSNGDRCNNTTDPAGDGPDEGTPIPPSLSSLGYEIECITPVDEDPPMPQELLKSAEDGSGLSGLDVLSCVASSQVRETCPRRRFSIFELPLSQFLDAAAAADADGGRRISSSSPDVISAGYNVPSAGDCEVVTSETMSRVMQQQNSLDSAAEQRSGDVFTALKVDVGQCYWLTGSLLSLTESCVMGSVCVWAAKPASQVCLPAFIYRCISFSF